MKHYYIKTVLSSEKITFWQLTFLVISLCFISQGQAAFFPPPTPLMGVSKFWNGGTSDHSCVVMNGGNIKCWGRNDKGQLGDETTTNKLTPITVLNLSSVDTVALGESHSCALITGKILCWGLNNHGQLGDGSRNSSPIPVNVANSMDMSAIALGGNHSCAVSNSGVVQCWGYNNRGQLGDGTITERLNLNNVNGLTNIDKLALGSIHSCAFSMNKDVQCWGDNSLGQLGDNSANPWRKKPESFAIYSVNFIASGYDHSCAITMGGGVKCWGQNNFGQLGNGETGYSRIPVDVEGLSDGLSDVSTVALGSGHSCALIKGGGMNDGGVKCWGKNDFGQLGDGTINSSLTPVSVMGFETNGAQTIALGKNHSCALTANGGVKCWGNNAFGQLGDNSTSNSSTPVDVLVSANIELRGNNLLIPSGDTSPDPSDFTDFGVVQINTSSVQTFVIHNRGEGTLNLVGSNSSITCDNNITSSLNLGDVSIDPLSSYSLTIGLTPQSVTSGNCTVTLVNNDPEPNKNPYTFTLTIQGTEKPPLTVIISPTVLTRFYGAPDPALPSFTYSGWLDGIKESIDIPPTLTINATETSPPGTYPITCNGGQDDKYLIDCSQPLGTLTVIENPIKPTLTVNALTITRPYGTPNPPLSPTYTGWIGSIEIIDTPPGLITDATETSPPGTYPIMCTTEGQDDNYLIVCDPQEGTLTVTLADTTTTLTPLTPNPSFNGKEVTFNFAVQPISSTPSVPTGEVKILQGTTPICQASLTNGLGTCTTSLNGIGSQTLTATYLGDIAFQGSTSEAISHFLLQAGYTSTPDPGEALNFGSTPLNTLRMVPLKIKETGTQILQVTLQDLTGDPDFKILTPLPMSIANGDPESVITLTCIPTSPGAHTATLKLSTNDPAQPTVSYPLTCEGQSTPSYESSPPINSILEIGNSQVGQSITFPLNVKEIGTEDLQVNFVDLTGPQTGDFQVLSPSFPFTLKNEAGTIQTIEIRCTPSDLGQREARLTLTSNDPQHPTITYPLECQGTTLPTAGYASLPDHLNPFNFGYGLLGQPLPLTFEVMETGNFPLTVVFKGISGPHAQDFSILSPPFPLKLPDGASPQAVILQCVPSAPGLRTAELAFTSNDPQHPLITYSLQCIGQGEVAYHSEPPPNGTINFGSLSLGKAQIISLSVNKTSKGMLDIVKAELTNASYFSLLNWKLPIPLQDTAKSLPLQCLPGEPGKHQTTLVVTLSDLSKISYSLLCYGLSENTEITQISLSNQVIAAHTRPEEVIGKFHSEVTGIAEPHFLYRLENAPGPFKVVEDQLILAKPLTFEQPEIYQITVKSVEENSGVEKKALFTIKVNAKNHPPTEIQLSSTVEGDQLSPTVVGERSQGLVGILRTLDPDKNDTHTYTLASSGQFILENGNEVHVAPGTVFKQPSYLIRVTSTDAGNLSVTQEFPIEIQPEARFSGKIRDEAGEIRKNGKLDESEGVALMGWIQPSAFHVGQLADLMFFYHWTPADGGRALEGSAVFAPQTRLKKNMEEIRFFHGKLLDLVGVFKIELGYRIGEKVWSEPVFALEVLPNRPPTKLELTMKPVLEKSPENTLIGTFRMEDPDRSEHFHYRLVDESKWQGYLMIKENQLLTGPWSLRWGQPYVVTIRGMDSSGASLEKTVTLEVLKDDSIGELRLTHAEVIERSAAGTPIGRFFILGEKEGNKYRLLEDAQGRFDLKEDILVVKAGEKLDSKVQSHHEIVAEVVRGSQRRKKAFSIEVLRDPMIDFIQ